MRILSDTQMQTARGWNTNWNRRPRTCAAVVPRSNVKVTALLHSIHRDSTKTTFDPENVVRSERTERNPAPRPRPEVFGTASRTCRAGGVLHRRIDQPARVRESEVNYEVGSETVVSQERGYDIKRLSVAVLVDDTTQDLEALSTLVKNAVGYDPVRDGAEGFTLASIPFDVREAMKTEQEAKDRRKWDLIGRGQLTRPW
jgi:flagellar biosynthesis/type III secretory pathway M-ring protein FliF/YscJ